MKDEDIFYNIDFYVDFENPEDRELYYEYLLEGLNGKYKLNNVVNDEEYPLEYNLYMFNVLKLLKQCDDFIHAVLCAETGGYRNSEIIEELLIEKGYVDDGVDYENWNHYADAFMTVKSLKDLLRKNKLKVSGRKQELVDRVSENNLSLDEFTTYECRFNENSEKYLKDNIWMEFYNIFLMPFEFSDFCRYYENRNGNVEDVALKYLDAHLNIATGNNDEWLLMICINAIKLINRYSEKLFENNDILD